MRTDLHGKQTLETQTTPGAPREVHPAYTLVFVVLAVLTALEVGTSYLSHSVKVPILIILAVVKVTLVLLFFMHLKYDRPIFSAAFVIGVVLAIPIILTITVVMPLLY